MVSRRRGLFAERPASGIRAAFVGFLSTPIARASNCACFSPLTIARSWRASAVPRPKWPFRSSSEWAKIQGASELLDISQAHIDSSIYPGEAGLEFAERLASLRAKVAVPSSLKAAELTRDQVQSWDGEFSAEFLSFPSSAGGIARFLDRVFHCFACRAQRAG